MDIRDARSSFPGLADKVFLDAACVSLTPVEAQRAIEELLRATVACDARDASSHHVWMDELRQVAVREGARLLEAGEDEIALVESTTYGLNVAAQAIPFEPGDNVVIADLEFLQVAIPWVKLAERGSLAEVRLARNAGGAIPPEAIAEQMDERTRAVVVSSVQWCNGYRLDLRALGELCRARGAFLVVDAIQELGALRLSVRDAQVDLLVAGGHKWLNAPFGCGLMYVSREAQPRLRQTTWGYLGLEPPEGGWPRYFATPSITPLRPYEFPPTARRFEVNGTSNYPGAVGLAASLGLVSGIGIEAVEAHVLALAGCLQDELAALGVDVVTPPDPAARSGITTFRVSDDPQENADFVERLLDERIFVSLRYTSGVGGIRVSTHYFNDRDDLDALLTAMRRLLERSPYGLPTSRLPAPR